MWLQYMKQMSFSGKGKATSPRLAATTSPRLSTAPKRLNITAPPSFSGGMAVETEDRFEVRCRCNLGLCLS